MKYQETLGYFNIATVQDAGSLPAAFMPQTCWFLPSNLNGLPAMSMLADLSPGAQNISLHPFAKTVAARCHGWEKAKKLLSSRQVRWTPIQVSGHFKIYSGTQKQYGTKMQANWLNTKRFQSNKYCIQSGNIMLDELIN